MSYDSGNEELENPRLSDLQCLGNGEKLMEDGTLEFTHGGGNGKAVA